MKETTTPPSEESQVRELVALPEAAKALGYSPQNLFSRLSRGTAPLRPIAKCRKRLFFDRDAVNRAAELIAANNQSPATS